jgi:phage shock protein A
MGIMTRILKVFKADLHDLMDRFENRDLLLRQYLRDMREEIRKKKITLREMTVSGDLAKRKLDTCKRHRDALKIDLKKAVRNGNDDIARKLIKKLKPLENLQAQLNRHAKTMDKEIVRLKNLLDLQQSRYDRIGHRSVEYFRKARTDKLEKALKGPVTARHHKITAKEVELELLSLKYILN